MSFDPMFRPAVELAGLVLRKEISATEIARATLAAIDAANPGLGAFLTVTDELAFSQAAATDERIARGDDPGPLAGVPVTIKDLTPVEGVRTTFGSRLFDDFVAPFDEHFVALLKNAGASITGKTNTNEFGATPITRNEIGPPARNPWDPSRTAGGSSGGAAAAVAAGLGPLAEGSDGGGSIRIPAAACGVVGLKPSRGRVSGAPGFGETWEGLAVSGPIARTVEDAALMLDVMSVPATGDPYWAPPPDAPFVEASRREPGRLRCALSVAPDGFEVDPEVRASILEAAETIAALGHVVEEAAPPIAGMAELLTPIYAASIAASPFELAGVAVDTAKLTPYVRHLWERGERIGATQHMRTVWTMQLLSRGLVAFFDTYDVLLTATLTSPAPPLDWFPEDLDRAYEDFFFRWFPYTAPFNMSGQPAISVPARPTAAGLPVGLQIVGRPADEATIISLAAQFESAAPWAGRRPGSRS